MLTIEQTNSVELKLKQISLEAHVLSNMVQSIKNIFPSLIDTLRKSFSQAEHLPFIEIKLSKEQNFVLKEINNFRFIDIASLSTQVPEGFQGDYLEYSKLILELVEQASTLNTRILQPYSTYLSSFLTNKESKIETKDQTRYYDNIKKTREEHISQLGHFFKDSDYTSKTLIGSVIKRNNDFKTVYEQTATIKKNIDSINLKTVDENVKKCLNLLDIIIRKIEKDEILIVSPEVTQNLSYGAYEVAREIEFFSVLYYKVLALLVSVDATTLKVNNFIKNIPN